MDNNTLRTKVDWIEKFINLAQENLRKDQSNLIFRRGKIYHVFNQYTIKGTSVCKDDSDIGEFSSLRVAISWCVADKYHQYQLAQQICNLDQRLQISNFAVETRRQVNNGNEINFAKLQHRIAQKFQIQAELEKYVVQAKYLQIRGFYDDTQRNSRNKTQKTSLKNI